MRIGAFPALSAGVLAAAGLVALLLAVSPALPARASQSTSSAKLAAVDVDPAGNTATSLGPLQGCAEIAAGKTLAVDVLVDAIPSDRPMTFFEYRFNYDPKVLSVTLVDNAQLLASNGEFKPVDAFSDGVPDTDGSLLVSVSDFGGATETGPGVLSRITVKALSTGVSSLQLESVDIRDDHNERLPIDTIAPARVAVGSTCASAGPTPGPTKVAGGGQTPGPGSTPGTDGTPEQGETPTPPEATATAITQATATASGTPIGSQGTPGQVNDGANGGDDDGGVGAWIIAPIALGILAAAGAGFFLLRRFRSGAP